MVVGEMGWLACAIEWLFSTLAVVGEHECDSTRSGGVFSYDSTFVIVFFIFSTCFLNIVR